jgi:transposase
MTEDVRWLVGIDWATQKHHVCLLDLNGRVVGEREFGHEGTGLSELCIWLLELTKAPPSQIAVAIETPHGPIVEMLLERGFQVYAINPKQLDRFRDRFTVAGAKDDSRDAHVLADALRTDRRAFRRLNVENPVVIELREWSRMAEDLQQERNSLANRVRQQLWRYYPQAIEIGGPDLAANWFLDLWQQVPTPAEAARVEQATIEGILKANRIRRVNADEVLRVLRQKPLWVAPGTAEAACAHIRTVAARIRLLNQQITQANRQLDELCDKLQQQAESAPGQKCEQRDVAILRSYPGLGRINIATLLAEAPEPLRQRNYDALRALCGAAPITRRSGKQYIVVRRYACNKRLQNAVYHWARVAAQHDPISRSRYAALRSRGHSHGRALRGVADRLLSVMCTLLRRQTSFDPNHASSKIVAA